MTALYEWSARHRGRYLHNRQTSMTPARFELACPTIKWTQNYALYRTDTGISLTYSCKYIGNFWETKSAETLDSKEKYGFWSGDKVSSYLERFFTTWELINWRISHSLEFKSVFKTLCFDRPYTSLSITKSQYLSLSSSDIRRKIIRNSTLTTSEFSLNILESVGVVLGM
jgi:hypothetical protein